MIDGEQNFFERFMAYITANKNDTETLLMLKPEHLSRIEILRTTPMAKK